MQAALLELETPLSEPFGTRQPLETWLTLAIQDHARLTATYQDKVFVAVVPFQDGQLIENLKHCLNRAMASETQPAETQTGDDNDTQVSHLEIFPSRTHATLILRGLLDLATVNQMYLTLTYLRKLFIVVVPLSREALLEEIEDWIDGANAEDALKEDGVISSEQLDKLLGW